MTKCQNIFYFIVNQYFIYIYINKKYMYYFALNFDSNLACIIVRI